MLLAIAATSWGFLSCPAQAATDWRLPEERQASALRWEAGFLVLGVIDTLQTARCLDRGVCEEANPIWGSEPSTKKLIAARVGLSLAHFAMFKYLNNNNPKAALRFAQVGCVLQGSAVALNARLAFK